MKFRMILIALMLAFTGSAFANHCPADMKKIDEAIAKDPKLATDEIKKLRADGEKLHKDGKHAESVETLGKAMKLLNIK